MTELARIKEVLGIDKRVGDTFLETALAASGRNGFPAVTAEIDRAMIYQWCDFCSNLKNERRTDSLELLNSVLSSSMYLCGRNVTPVDVIVFVSIQKRAASLTFEEKEKYLNFGRWFQYMQDHFGSRGRRECPRIIFSKTALR